MANDLVVIANGATVTARVTVAEPAQRKGKGGRLDVVFDTVELVAGGTTPIRAMSSGSGGGRREMVGNMVTSGLLTAGLAAPLFLLQRGNEVEIRSGEKFGAALARELTLPRAEVAAHQPTPSEPRTDIATVYVIKGTLKGVVDRRPPQLSMGEWPFAIGERNYQLSSSSALRIELPPGQYWLHIWHAPLNKLEPEELISINAKGRRVVLFSICDPRWFFRFAKSERGGRNRIDQRGGHFRDLAGWGTEAEQLERLRVQPSARNVADAALAQRAMQPSAPPESSEPDTPDAIHLRAGQQVSFVLKTRLSSEHNKVGDVVDLEVVRAVKVDGLVVIAAGTQAQAEVVVQFGNSADTILKYVKELQKSLKEKQDEIRERNREIEEGVFTATADPKKREVPPSLEEVPVFMNFAPLENGVESLGPQRHALRAGTQRSECERYDCARLTQSPEQQTHSYRTQFHQPRWSA